MADDGKLPLHQETSAWDQYEDELNQQREVVQNKVVQELISASETGFDQNRRDSGSGKKGYALFPEGRSELCLPTVARVPTSDYALTSSPLTYDFHSEKRLATLAQTFMGNGWSGKLPSTRPRNSLHC